MLASTICWAMLRTIRYCNGYRTPLTVQQYVTQSGLTFSGQDVVVVWLRMCSREATTGHLDLSRDLYFGTNTC